VLDLLINLLASVIAGAAVWVAQRLFRLRKMNRKRGFFGVSQGEEVLLFVAKHYSSPKANSVHRNDVATLIELAAVIRECGGTPTLLIDGESRPQAGRVTEYCVGGPSVNPRTEAYLRTTFPGIEIKKVESDDRLAYFVGSKVFTGEPGREEYVLLARVHGPSNTHPAFLLIGQTSESNLAAARMLAVRYPELSHQYPDQQDFCLALRLRESGSFGPDLIEIIEDVTADAKTVAVEPVVSSSQDVSS
jgi:hypothetical protein